jgi:cytochrome c oxidase cbb3-type subunit 4
LDILVFFHSIWTVVVLIFFVSVVIWAYSSKRKQTFDEAARLPLEDDDSLEVAYKEQHHV